MFSARTSTFENLIVPQEKLQRKAIGSLLDGAALVSGGGIWGCRGWLGGGKATESVFQGNLSTVRHSHFLPFNGKQSVKHFKEVVRQMYICLVCKFAYILYYTLIFIYESVRKDLFITFECKVLLFLSFRLHGFPSHQ